MIVHVIRHGKTFQDSSTGRDHDRVLKPKGHRQARALGALLAAHEHRPGVVVSSPTVRAMETSASIWEALGMGETVDDRIECGRGVSDMIACVQGHEHNGPVAIVSHNPTVSRFVDVLVEGPGAGFTCSLRTGEVVTLRVREGVELGGAEVLGSFRDGD